MDCFNILGIKEGASKEEIRQAYEKQVNKFNNEVRDKKKLDKFLSLFKAAYDEIMKEFEEKELEEKIIKNIEEEYTNNKGLNENEEIKEAEKKVEENYDLDCTVKMSAEEIQEIIRKSKENTLTERHIAISKEEFLSLDDSEDEEIVEIRKRNNKNKPIKSKAKKKNNKNNTKEKKENKNYTEKNSNDSDENNYINRMKNNEFSENKNVDEKQSKVKGQKVVVKKSSDNNNILNLIKVPFKILVIPVILILSIIIFLFKIINLTCFLVSKVIIVGAIGIAAIHGYQIYIGHPMQWEIFALCALATIVAFFLPTIVRVVPNMLGKINTSLKNFAF